MCRLRIEKNRSKTTSANPPTLPVAQFGRKTDAWARRTPEAFAKQPSISHRFRTQCLWSARAFSHRFWPTRPPPQANAFARTASTVQRFNGSLGLAHYGRGGGVGPGEAPHGIAIRVYDEAGNVIETHEHVGNTGLALPDRRFRLSAVFGLCVDDVRIWAREVAVFGRCVDDVRIWARVAAVGPYLDDVRIWARAVAVVRPHPVIIERIRSQPGNVLVGDIADIPILVSRHVTVKGTARGDVQPVTGRIAYAAPVRSEAAGSLVSCL